MRETTEIFIPIPKTRNTHCKVEIDGDDITNRTTESSWVIPLTSGIGTFKIVLSNAHGQYSGTYQAGDVVKFYADNLDNTTLQFWGRIDYVKDNIGKDGQFLEIEGRHRAYLLTEYLVCHSATNTASSQILKDVIDKMPASYGFTQTNIGTTTDSMSVEWNYKPFWDCVIELSTYAGYDCYVDNNLDFHFFEANSIVNTTDAIVEGDNLLDSKNWGTNDYYEKTRVTVMGQNENGLPVIYTAISPNEVTEIREVFIKDTSVNTEAKAQDLADAKLSELTNRTPQATVKSFGLETIKPGDNIWILIPRQEIHGQYKIIQITHSFGMKIGGWRTECVFEQDEGGMAQIIQNLNQKSNRAIEAKNIDKLNYSWNFEFDTNTGTHSSTQIIYGVLKTSQSASGVWTSESKTITSSITECKLMVYGGAVAGTNFYISVDNGARWQPITPMELKTISQEGNNLKMKVELNSASTQIGSMAFLYS